MPYYTIESLLHLLILLIFSDKDFYFKWDGELKNVTFWMNIDDMSFLFPSKLVIFCFPIEHYFGPFLAVLSFEPTKGLEES